MYATRPYLAYITKKKKRWHPRQRELSWYRIDVTYHKNLRKNCRKEFTALVGFLRPEITRIIQDAGDSEENSNRSSVREGKKKEIRDSQ